MTVQQRLHRITHETIYRYDAPVRHSEHEFRLRPVNDELQTVRDFQLEVSPAGDAREFDDILGNRVTYYRMDQPFTEMRIVSRSVVEAHAPPPIHRPLPKGPSVLPLMWSPAQHQVLQPYLLPPDLPQEQLRELFDHARSVAERLDYDLIDVIAELTASIQRDYEYVPGVTSVETTPYECFMHRRGVCQDFTNLLMVLARLLNVPSRYRVGYIFTGGDYANRAQSDASHAWVECYLPWVGWRGFDPTNGCMTGADHVRVAWGRTHHEATPTTGKIHAGGGGETLGVSVRVEEAVQEEAGQVAAVRRER